MTYKENIKAILECHFAGFKEEIIDSAYNRILEQVPVLDEVRAEIELQREEVSKKHSEDEGLSNYYFGLNDGLKDARDIIDKYKKSEGE